MSIWDVADNGFLCNSEPIAALTINNEKYIPVVVRLENIMSVLPYWIQDRRVREELVHNLREIAPLIDGAFLLNQDESKTERLMQIYSYMAMAYVNGSWKDTKADRLTTEISVPLTMLAEKLGRKPTFSYTSYCLCNWQKKNPDANFEIDNLKTLANMTDDSAKESVFILKQAYLEYIAADGVKACKQIIDDTWKPVDFLNRVLGSLRKINEVLDLPLWYPQQYLENLDEVSYEGRFEAFQDKELFLNGTPNHPVAMLAFRIALEFEDFYPLNPELVSRMPVQHQKFFSDLVIQVHKNSVEGRGIRSLAEKNSDLMRIFKECSAEISEFRDF